jgi:hypothetical protein
LPQQQTTFGDKYLITPESVARHISQIEELASATRRDLSRQDATPVAAPSEHIPQVDTTATTIDKSRQDAKGRDLSPQEQSAGGTASEPPTSARHVEQLEKRIEEKDDFIVLLKGQLTAKDGQIRELSERYRETHTLLGAMQRMLAPLLGQGDPYKAPEPTEARSVDNPGQ